MGLFCCKRKRMTVVDDLSACDESTEKFSLNGITTRAKCVKVHDGDSAHLVFKYGGKLTRFVCRLRGIDAAELRGPDVAAARLARDYLRDMIFDKIVTVKCYDFDKYGRLLTDIFLNNTHVNQKMIDDGYAKAYDGGRKN